MNDPVYNSWSLTSVAGAITQALGVPAPAQAEAANPAISALVGDQGVDRIVMYNPDAVALWLYQRYTARYLPLLRHTALTLPLASVMPSVTPVCFGTMYTGAMPAVHGIQSYVKPVIAIDTVFDALLRAGKRPAIVSTAGDSLSLIFLEREMDYFIYDTVEEVNAKAMELIGEDRYDLIVIYNGDYDTAMHRWAPEGEAAMAALEADLAFFDGLCTRIGQAWQGRHRTLVAFAPDHGCHEIDGGLGSHGLDMPEDINILHFYGIL